MEHVRIAVIGSGLIGARHAELVNANAACELVGVCDTDPARKPVAEALGVPFSSSVAEIIERQQPNGAIIATPNSAHAPACVACAERGVHVLVEKPIADTLDHARQIIAAASQHGISVLVGHHRRHNPLIRKACELVRDGTLGTLIGFSALWTLLKPDDYFQAAWRRERPGGGPLLINLIHDLDSLRFICGEVKSVYARMSSSARRFPVEDSLSISLTMESGALGTILASDATPAPWSYETTTAENPVYFHAAENCCHFVGTRASLAFPRMELWRYPEGAPRGWTHPLECRRIEVAVADPLQAQLEHFCLVLRGEQEPLINAEDAARSLAVALAAQKSAETGAVIEPSAV